MKYSLSVLFMLLFLLCCKSGFCCSLAATGENTSTYLMPVDTVKIISSPDLNELISGWIRIFGESAPSVKFSLSTLSGEQEIKPGTICFTTDGYSKLPGNSTDWKIGIGHNAVVPVINAENPMINEISRQGISDKKFAKMISVTGRIYWSDLINNGRKETINTYLLDEPGLSESLASFTGTSPGVLNCNVIKDKKDFVNAVQSDPYSVGFCNLADIRKAGTDELTENIRLLPIDKNSNGRIDNFEKIYDSPEELSRGVWIGKYPRELSGSIYAVSPTRPDNENAVKFLSWVVTVGGQYLTSSGYSELAGIERQSGLSALVSTGLSDDETANTSASSLWLILLTALVIAGIFAIIVMTINFTRRKPAVREEAIRVIPALNERLITAPKGVYFDKTHTWTFMEKDGLVRVGIDDFLQHITGTITGMNLKEPGDYVRRGEQILTIIKDGKKLNLYAPVSGTIKSQNTDLYIDASLINSSPCTDGWIYLIEPKNWVRESQFMILGERYGEWLKDEFMRLRNFFEASMKSNNPAYNYIILQDGGELADNVLADLGPEVWEDFQTKFIDPSK